MKQRMEIVLNGQPEVLEVEPSDSLLTVLRRDFRLTGAKEGCGEGECGACTVIMDGLAINSCLLPALEADGAEVWTVEGLSAPGAELHPLQQSFVDHGAIQCGFCTPGMVMSAKALLDADPRPDEQAVRTAIEGNLCRCTGYHQIVQAVLAAAEKMA